ncbi:hypothetical protein SAMN05421825_3143 [Epilithonimonas hungarica]|uniref:Uncharacterized protein n=1 Tax=Epilithonimonas hungarica TaxID=454006 RepID=A0A1G7TKT0_9FLAO|nr:hypothetical protein SAMN05421825_3143 [Epilithonimonas hungarica]
MYLNIGKSDSTNNADCSINQLVPAASLLHFSTIKSYNESVS